MNDKHISCSSILLKEIGDWIIRMESDGDSTAKRFIDLLSDETIDDKKVFCDVFKWIEGKATQENDPMALYLVGRCHLEGELVPKDCEAGIEYLKKSSEQGNADAFYWLGNYYKDNGNNEAAIKCYREAEKLGHELAFTARKIIECTE